MAREAVAAALCGGDYEGDGVASSGHESGRRNTKKRMEAAAARRSNLELSPA